MDLCQARQLHRRNDQPARVVAAAAFDGLRLHGAEARQAPGLRRHDAETPLGIAFRRLYRKRPHPASSDLFGERSDRFTLCLSTQVGCAYGCKFCASGLEGFKRNLTAGEVVAQILETERATKTRINNLVFMGMGEPLANYANLMKALEIINAPWGVGIGARHITVSTSGLAPQIRELATSRCKSGWRFRSTARPTRCASGSCR